VGQEFQRCTREEQAAAIAKSLEETEITAVQMDAIANTGRSVSFDDAKAIVAQRRAAKSGIVQQPGAAAQLATDDQPVQQPGDSTHVVSRVPPPIPGQKRSLPIAVR